MNQKLAANPRYAGIKQSLVGMAGIALPMPTEFDLALKALAAARLAKLMPTDELKDFADKKLADISDHIKVLSAALKPIPPMAGRVDDQSTPQSALDDAADKPQYNPASKFAVHELMALNKEKPQRFSKPDYANINQLLASADKDTKALGTIALAKQESLFDMPMVGFMQDVVDFLKGENEDISDTQLTETFLVSKARLDQDLVRYDESFSEKGLPNFISHKTFEELSYRSEAKPALASMLFENIGKPFEPTMYQHSTQAGNEELAMSLLGHSKFGLLARGTEISAGNPQALTLMQIIAQAGGSQSNLSRLANLASTPRALSALLDSMIDSHNDYYNKQNLASVIDSVGNKLSIDQINRLGDKLSKNHERQPVMPAIQSLIDTSTKKGVDTARLEDSITLVRNQLGAELKALELPMASYSGVVLTLPYANTSLAIRDAKSVPHLKSLLLASIADPNIDTTYTIDGADSLLDQTVKAALTNFIASGDALTLNTLMTSPIHKSIALYQGDAEQLLFEANKQNKLLPPLNVDSINMMADIVDRSAAIYYNGTEIMKLHDLHNSYDFIDKVETLSMGALTMDATKLGHEYDDKLRASLKALINDPKDSTKQNHLNELVGLPVELLSSKIENTQENSPQSDNFIKNTIGRVADKTNDVISSIRRP